MPFFEPANAIDAKPECGAPGPLATSPCIVPLGHVQVEGDLLSLTRGPGSTGRTAAVGPLILKVPLSPRTQAELGISPYRFVTDARGARTRMGPAAVSVRQKVALTSTPRLSAALHAGIAVPLRDGGRPEVSLGLPVAARLSEGWALTLNPEAAVSGRDGSGTLRGLVAVSGAVSREWVVLAEWASARVGGAHSAWSHEVILGADFTHRAHDTLHVGVGVGLGVSRSAPARRMYLTFSKRL